MPAFQPQKFNLLMFFDICTLFFSWVAVESQIIAKLNLTCKVKLLDKLPLKTSVEQQYLVKNL